MGFLSAEQLLLDEAQGVTTDMIVECIGRRGWHLTASGFQWQALDKSTSRVRIISALHGGILAIIATHEEMTLQGVLREINPRMRQGMPSHAAIKAHDENMMKEGNDSGRWIAVRKCDKNAEVTVVRFVFGLSCVKVWFDTAKGTSDIRHEEGQWSFWPCDHKGNKVRWPTDDNGNML